MNGASPLARAVRTKSDASTASIEARVMRAIGASEKIAERQRRQDQLLEARRGTVSTSPAMQAVDQVEAGDLRRRR